MAGSKLTGSLKGRNFSWVVQRLLTSQQGLSSIEIRIICIKGRGTMLQTGRSLIRFPMISLFSVDQILPFALWPWSRLRL
jgi:hypothetical protein